MVDEKFLEPTLDLGNGWIDCLLRIGCRCWSLRSWGRGRFDVIEEGRLLLNRANWARLLVLDGSRLWSDGLLVLDGNLETKLKLGLCSTIELLIDGGVIGVENYEGCRAVGVTFEDGFRGRWDSKEEAKLCAKQSVNIVFTLKMIEHH